MKTAIYCDEGLWQIVLTPESDWERKLVEAACGTTQSEPVAVPATVLRGGFCATRGGWTRESGNYDSLIVRLEPKV